MLGKLIAPTIAELVRDKDFRSLKEDLAGLPSADLADIIADLEDDLVSVVFRLLSKEQATEVFEYLDVEHQHLLLRSLSDEWIAHLLSEMSVDDRTTLLDELPPEVAAQLLEVLPEEDRALARAILNYPEDTVGRLITPDYVEVTPELTVSEALDRIREFGKDKETVYACYVIGEHRKLLGFVSLRKLVTSPLQARIDDLYQRNFVSLETGTPAEEAVEIIRRYDLIALPVLDKGGNMVGIVTVDDLMDVAEEEFREDMELMAAVVPGGDQPFLEEPVLSSVWRRLPWLLALLLVEGLAVFLLARYNILLEEHIALSFFLPALIATGGNTGTQGASMVIRALAVGEVGFAQLARVILRSVRGGLLLALMLGAAGFVMATVIKSDLDIRIALCVSLGLAAVVIMANIAGSVFPLLLKRVGLDPALMSSPFISTIVDILGLVIYMEISRAILTI